MRIPLTRDTAGDVLKVNEKLANKVLDEAMDGIYYQVDEVLQVFTTLKDYCIGYGCYNYIKAKDFWDMKPKDFFEECKEADNSYGIFTVEKYETGLKLAEKYDDYMAGYDEDMTEEAEEELEKELLILVNELAEELKTYLVGYYEQYENIDILNEYFLDIWLENHDDFLIDTDTKKVYQNITIEY